MTIAADTARAASMDFDGKIALVTGAGSGIGRATALRLRHAGARVALVGRNRASLDRVAAEVEARSDGDAQAGDSFLSVAADVTIEVDAERAIAECLARFGRLDVLVNAAGQISNGTIESTSLAAWDELMQVNLRAVFHMMQLAAPALRDTRGNIVNVSSVTGLRAFPGVLAYCVSKAAVDQLTRCAALELAAAGVRVNAVNPGVVVTELHRRGGMSEPDYEKFIEKSASTHPLGRAGSAEEVAELIAYLASPHAAWITGVTYSIDGGRAQTCAR